MTEKLTRGGVRLGFVITNKGELVGNVKVRNIFGCNDHEIVEFRILREGNKANSRIAILACNRADFGLRNLLGRMPRNTSLERNCRRKMVDFQG